MRGVSRQPWRLEVDCTAKHGLVGDKSTVSHGDGAASAVDGPTSSIRTVAAQRTILKADVPLSLHVERSTEARAPARLRDVCACQCERCAALDVKSTAAAADLSSEAVNHGVIRGGRKSWE